MKDPHVELDEDPTLSDRELMASHAALEREGIFRQPVAFQPLLANEHYPVIAGADRFGAFVMFGSFRSAMPSREVADTIAQMLSVLDVYPHEVSEADFISEKDKTGNA